MTKTLITCDCLGSQQIDAEGLARTTGLKVPAPCTALCTAQVERAAKAIEGGEALIACTQEARLFEALADEMDRPPPPLVDLRDRAGWSDEGDAALPKMAALVAEALVPAPPARALDVVSEGACLVLGAPETTLAAAEALAGYLGVTVLLEDDGAELPLGRDYDVIVGKLRAARGALGRFEVEIDGLRQLQPGGRGAFTLTEPRDGARSDCDVILDLRGGAPLFAAPVKREGYLRADPGRPEAVAAAVREASHMVGTFEQPLYVRTEPTLCAHSRAGQTGCTRCLDLCPTGAIVPDGEHVAIDPAICAGCGACSSVCPSGAVSYDAPPVDVTLARVQTLARAFLEAGGSAPRLLVHDAHGAEMIRLAARFSRGLPADVVPLEMPNLGAFGHAEALAALAAGFGRVSVLPGPDTDLDPLAAQLALAEAVAGEGRLETLDIDDPEALAATLYDAPPPPAPVVQPVRPMGSRRQVTRLAARALAPDAEVLALPEGAPYGAVLVDTEACTLCLSCVSLCPSGALGDNPDKPQLRFQEDACLQCGICASVCPEDAIGYEPRLDLTEAALSQRILNEEEPFACVECGALFGSRSAIERITEKLTGHAMFADPAKLRTLQMCDDCRVRAQFGADDNPFAAGERPRPRTTDDYYSDRKDH